MRDDGFSLSELLVVISLLGIVLSTAWALMSLGQRGSEISNREAWTSREIGAPLLEMERMLSQNVPPLQEAGPYSVKIRTDRNRDYAYEYYTFAANTDGNLVQTAVGGNASGSHTWSYDNRNTATTTPLFTYYDINGNDISASGIDTIKQYTTSVMITIVAEHEGRQFTDSRRVFFRNR